MKVSVSLRAKFHAFHLAQQLYDRGSLDRLFTSYYGSFMGKKQNNKGFSLPKAQVKTNPLSAYLTYMPNPFGNMSSYKYFGNWSAEQLKDEDVVISWVLSATPVIKKAKQLGIKSVVDRGSSHVLYQRDILLEEYDLLGLNNRLLLESFNSERIERETEEYHQADKVLIPSNFVERTFLANNISPDKIIKVPYGVDLRNFYPTIKTDNTFRVIYVGNMSIRKGVHYLLKAFSELHIPNAELWLIGSMTDDIKPYFRKYHDFFKYYPPVPQADLVKYMGQSDVFVMCSIEEGLAMVQPQAMACGLPLICTTNTGGDNLVENGKEGYVLPIRGVEILKEKLLYLYENREYCKELGLNAVKKVKSGFTWNDYGEKVHEAMLALATK